MSVSNEVQNADLSDDDDIKKQRWFFTLLSESQAETILNEGTTGKQTRASRFLVSNVPSSKDYRISIRRTEQAGRKKKNTIGNVEHIIVTYNEEDQSYGIEGQNRCQSIVEVVRNYVASCDYPLEPFSGSLEVKSTDASTKPVLMSLVSIESTQIEEPPPYTAAMQYPTDKRPLPQIKTKLDPNKAQEAKLESSFRVSSTSSGRYGHDRGCCWGACDSGDEWYSFRDAGWLRRVCLTVMLIILIVIVGIFCGCCLFTIFIFFVCCAQIGCCEKCEECCPSCCDCDDFCEEHCDCLGFYDDD